MAPPRRRSASRWDPWEGRGPFPPSVPRAVEGGLKARSRRGPIGDSWWSQRFIAVLESFDLGARLQRGKRYARMGQVVGIEVAPGRVSASVQGSRARPYQVLIGTEVLGERDWDRVEEAMVARALFSARLLAGEMPAEIEEAFAACSLSLFPAHPGDLDTACSCPDWANPCKHVAATYYLLAEAFDDDPFLIFAWRGRTKDELLGHLRRRRGSPGAGADPSAGTGRGWTAWADLDPGSPALAEGEPPPEGFWSAGPGLREVEAHPRAVPVPDALLRQLPPLALEARGEGVSTLLAPALLAAAPAAAARAVGEGAAGPG